MTPTAKRSSDGSGTMGAFLALAVLVTFLFFASVDANSGVIHTEEAAPCDAALADMAVPPEDSGDARTSTFVRLLCDGPAVQDTEAPRS